MGCFAKSFHCEDAQPSRPYGLGYSSKARLATGAWIAFALLLGGATPGRAELAGPRFGIQAGVGAPTTGDLRITSGSGAAFTGGVHGLFALGEHHALKVRLEKWRLPEGQQTFHDLALEQTLATKVGAVALGAEYLYRPGGSTQRWSGGPGLYLLKWSVASVNTFSSPSDGNARETGSSSWTRQGLGALAACRITPHLDAEVRFISSHYGYENLQTNLALLGLSWRF